MALLNLFNICKLRFYNPILYITPMSFVKPGYAQCPVEVLPEVQVDQVVVAGTDIANYSNYGKRLLEIRNLTSSRPAANPIETIIATDIGGEAQKLYSAAQSNVRVDLPDGTGNKAIAREYLTIRQRSIGGPEANIINRWHVVVRNYNLLDLYRWGIKPENALVMIEPRLTDTDRTRILEAANIVERGITGNLPTHADLLNPMVEEQFEMIKEVDRQIPALAANGGSHILGGQGITVPAGYIAVVLSFAVDSQQIVLNLAAGTGPFNCCFMYFSKDDLENYVRMDAAGMPNAMGGAAGTIDFDMRCFIPVTRKFQLQIVNNHTISPVAANLRVRMRYGLRKMTLVDHEKWGIPYPTNDEAAAIALLEKYKIKDSIYIGEQ